MTRIICSQSVGLRLARKWLSEPQVIAPECTCLRLIVPDGLSVSQIARRCFACAVMSQLLYAFASDPWVRGRRLIAADCG